MNPARPNLSRVAWKLDEALALLDAVMRENTDPVVNEHLADAWPLLKGAFAAVEHARSAAIERGAA